MMLSGYTVSQFLLNTPNSKVVKKTYKAIFEGNFSAKELINSSRNDVYLVELDNETYIIKQPKKKENRTSLLLESKFYKLKPHCKQNVRFVCYDSDFDILLLKNDIKLNIISNSFLSKNWKLLFKKLAATIHNYNFNINKASKILDNKVPIYFNSNTFNQEIIFLDEYPSFLLKKIGISLKNNMNPILNLNYNINSIIHNDLKMQNIIYGYDGSNELIVEIVDWELVCLGDFRWDLAILISPFLKNTFTEGNDFEYAITPHQSIIIIKYLIGEYCNKLQKCEVNKLQKEIILMAVIYLLEQIIVNIRFKKKSDENFINLANGLILFLNDFDNIYNLYFETDIHD